MFYISTPSCHFALLRGQFVISCFQFSIDVTTSLGRKYLVCGPNTGIMPFLVYQPAVTSAGVS